MGLHSAVTRPENLWKSTFYLIIFQILLSLLWFLNKSLHLHDPYISIFFGATMAADDQNISAVKVKYLRARPMFQKTSLIIFLKCLTTLIPLPALVQKLFSSMSLLRILKVSGRGWFLRPAGGSKIFILQKRSEKYEN